MLFSDDWIFKINRISDSQNVRIRDTKCREEHSPEFLNSFGALTRFVVTIERTIRPNVLSILNVTDERYKNILPHHAFPWLWLLQQDYIFQHDGVLSHRSKSQKDYLNTKCLKNWIERSTLGSWPQRSPDLKSCSFLFEDILNELYILHPFIPQKMLTEK